MKRAATKRVSSQSPKSKVLNVLDTEITLSFGKKASDAYPWARTLTISDILHEFGKPDTARSKLTSSEYHALTDKAQQHLEKDGAYFVSGVFGNDGRRSNDNVKNLHAFTLDFDSGRTTRKEIEEKLKPYTYIAYSSYSHRPGHERWRVIIPYALPVTPEQHAVVFEHFQELFDGDLDTHCKNPSQLWYTPACPHDAVNEFQCFHNSGALFDPAETTAPSKCKPDKQLAKTKTIDRLVSALLHLDSDNRKTWIDVGMAIKHDLGDSGLKVWLSWSEKSKKFNLQQALSTWETLKPDTANGITLASVFHRAKDNGWLDTDTSSDIPDFITEMNQTYFLAPDGSKTFIYRESDDPLFNRKRLDSMQQHDFRLLHANKMVNVINAHGKPGRKCIADVWISHPHRREYKGIVLSPGKEVPDHFNLWRGFNVKSKKGNCRLIKRHIKEILCNGDSEAYEYLMNWLAFAIQNPGKQAEVAVVMRGGRGTGKGILARAVGRLFGQHFVHISHSRHLTGNFNAHLRDCIVLFVDEAFWAGDKQGEAELKRLVTEPTLTIERKGKDVIMTPNMLHIIMASNSQWVVPAGTDERRFFVMDVSAGMKQNLKYFTKLQGEIDNGGLQALLYELQQRDITNFDIRRFPQTKALLEQKLLSLDPHEKWWFQKLCDGVLLSVHEDWGVVSKSALHDDYVQNLQKTGISRRSTQTELGMKLRTLLPKGYPKTRRNSAGNAGGGKAVPQYQFPPLEECRTHFESVLRLEGFDWEQGKIDAKSEGSQPNKPVQPLSPVTTKSKSMAGSYHKVARKDSQGRPAQQVNPK